VPEGNPPLVAPLYQSVKFTAATVQEAQAAAWHYSRVGNPTCRQLELSLARLQGRDDAIVCASGVGVISQTLFGLLQQGDHVLCFAETYGPTRGFIRRQLARYGVSHTMLSIHDDAGIERVLATTPTRLVILESPTNPVLRIADIAHITRCARRAGALTLLDNTLAGPHQHGDQDIDLYLHSLTKYVSGHGDVMGGAVIGNRELIRRLRPEFIVGGGTLDPHAAFLLQRGLKTCLLRYRAQSAAAQQVAEFLARQPQVARVHYPGLATHERHALARAQMQDFGAVVSFDMAGGAAAGDRLADHLELFAIAASMGSPESLVMPPGTRGPLDLPSSFEPLCGIVPGTVRLSIGLEDIGDLLADLAQALQAC
jgi:cystathionine beta-lyase/cystathionine gamma-synthase